MQKTRVFKENKKKRKIYNKKDYMKEPYWTKRILYRTNWICAALLIPALLMPLAAIFSPYDKVIFTIIAAIAPEVILVPIIIYIYHKDKKKCIHETALRYDNKITVSIKNYQSVIVYTYRRTHDSVASHKIQTQPNLIEEIIYYQNRDLLKILCGCVDFNLNDSGDIVSCSSYQVGNGYFDTKAHWVEIPLVFDDKAIDELFSILESQGTRIRVDDRILLRKYWKLRQEEK